MGWAPGWDSVASAGWWSGFFFWASIISLLLLGVNEVVSHRYSERKDELAAEEQRKEKDRNDLEIARLHNETAIAQRTTEELRRENLELQRAISPRILEISAPLFALRKYEGTEVRLSNADDPDAKILAGALMSALRGAGWIVSPAAAAPPPPLSEGVHIEYLGEAGPAHVLSAHREEIAEALKTELKKQDIEANVRRWPQRTADNDGRIIPPEGLAVHVGRRPQWFFLEKKFPQLKGVRERLDRP